MAAKKETMMMLKVDLDCPRCYKKVKELLCSIRQVKDQICKMNENTVKIKVVCCCPEKIRDRICRKGGETIKDIQIMEPPKKLETAPKTQTPEKEKPPKNETATAPAQPNPPRKMCCSDCYEGRTTGPCYTGCRYGYGYAYRYGYGYGILPPPPPPPGGWVYYGGCPPCGYEYRPGYYCTNYENPSSCVIM